MGKERKAFILAEGIAMRSETRTFSDLFLHPDNRWDSEYFCFAPYKNNKLKYAQIGDILSSSQYGISIEMNEEKIGTKIYRMNEISNMLCDRDILKCAPINQEEVNLFRLKDRDVLFNRTNSQSFVGRTGIFREFSSENFVFASYLIRINPYDDIITPEYLTAFLNTKYGVMDVKRRARVSINQSNVNAEELKQVEIPLICKELQIQITSSFDRAFDFIQESERKHNQAQTLLLSELCLSNWQPKHQLSFVKNYSELREAERIDAEYFQPKYDEIVKAIKGYSGGWDTLGNITSIKKCVEVGSEAYIDEGEIPFVRVSNLSPFEITEEKYISNELYAELSQHQPQQGEILFSKDGTSGIAYHLNEKPKKMIPSGGILRLKIRNKQINEDYLTLVLNSLIVQEQINRDVGGSIILHWRPDQVKQTLIPILDDEKQKKIRGEIAESFNLRKQSKRLLQCAKRAVEIAIEQNEDVAIKWLQAQTKEARHGEQDDKRQPKRL